MKRSAHFLIFCMLFTLVANARVVDVQSARQLAEKFCLQYIKVKPLDVQLQQTETTSKGVPVYYVFSTSSTGGFIIISAEDAAHPVIGYSPTGEFKLPDPKANIAIWMQKRKEEIEFIRLNNLLPDADISNEWAGAFGQTAFNKGVNPNLQSVAPLCQTTWNQSPYYNAMCPSGCLTGCVATAMSQIMRYWSWPVTGTGSSSYCDCTQNGFTQNNGTLSANYGTTTYNWANMPNYISSNNNDVALINFHCGVSVQMDYTPNFSGAWVINADNPICAQNSYVQYFKYDPNTIQGLKRANYSDPQWIQLLENDLNLNRPIQYAGWDPSAGGHTWVCDGYDVNNNLHMNWGWGGYSNGYYALNNLNPGGYNFSNNHEACIGIQPLNSVSNDAGILSIVTPNGNVCSGTFTPVVQLHNYGNNTLTSCVIKYHIDNNANQTFNWNGSLASGNSVNVTLAQMSTTSGAHTFTAFTQNPNSATDGNSSNDQTTGNFNVSTGGALLPLVEGFESSANLPANWTLSNPDNDAQWEVSTTVARTGSNCMGFNNCNGDGNTDMTGRKDWVYTKPLSFANVTSASMSFDVAYAPASYQNVQYNDTLAVFYSVNCGQTWSQLYKKGGNNLATAPVYVITSSNCWAPASNEWRNELINLPSQVNNQGNVIFAFENISGWGEWVYVDNINIYSNTTTGVSSNDPGNGFQLFPNPAKGSVTISGTSLNGKVRMMIYDAAGQVVRNSELHSAGNDFSEIISTGDIAPGIYFVRVSDDTNTWYKKLVIE